MKWHKFLKAATMALIIFTGTVEAQENIYPEDIGAEKINEPTSPAPRSPFSFSAFIDGTSKAKINKGFYKDDKFQFAVANVEGSFVYYYNPVYEEAANVSLAYMKSYFGWAENPWFEQTHFDTLTLSFGGITNRVDRWTWRSQVQFNYDGFDKISASYFNYNLMLWGRYALYQDIGIHMGFFLETGMRMDHIYPILGFDWKISEKWRLSAVFPTDMILEYKYTRNWTFAIAGRTFSNRHRAEPHENQNLVRYTNFGLEAMVKYMRYGIVANVHAGVTTGGRLRLANKFNHHPDTLHLDPAGYVGAAIDAKY